MGTLKVDLKVSEEIGAGLDVCDTYVPPNGAEVWVDVFHGNAAFTTNSAVMLLWDYGGAGEEIVWSTKGSENFKPGFEITGADGVKKIALCCSNGEVGDLVLSGLVRLKVIT